MIVSFSPGLSARHKSGVCGAWRGTRCGQTRHLQRLPALLLLLVQGFLQPASPSCRSGSPRQGSTCPILLPRSSRSFGGCTAGSPTSVRGPRGLERVRAPECAFGLADDPKPSSAPASGDSPRTHRAGSTGCSSSLGAAGSRTSLELSVTTHHLTGGCSTSIPKLSAEKAPSCVSRLSPVSSSQRCRALGSEHPAPSQLFGMGGESFMEGWKT